MVTPPRRAPKSRPLNRQLLFSHLSVAFVGLVMLGIALVATYDLRARVILLANESGPMAQASFQLLAGVRHSLASLRGWVTLGDRRFLENWHSAWRDEIQPALDQLKSCPPTHDQNCIPQRLRELRALLADLQESQWWVRDIVRTPGNEPARVVYTLEAEPRAAALHSLLAALFQEEKELEGGPERKALLGQLAESHHAFSTAHLLLREILGADGLSYETRFQEALESVRARIGAVIANPLLTPEQRQHLDLLRDELRAFANFAQEVIRLRQRADWNIALNTLALETDPLAERAVAQAAALAMLARTRLEQEILATQAASAITVWSLILMIVAMLVVAYVLAKKHAEAIALPITSLAEATRQLASGRLYADIPIGDNDELGELTQSFNTMRASMQEAQEKLRETNVSLEQRVAERTAELAAANAALTQEIAVRSQTEQALRESEARLLAMTKAIPDLVFVVDEDGRYREILASRGDLVAIGPLRGKLLSEVYSRGMADYFLDIIHRALATQRIQVAEYELQTASGLRWFESRTAPLDVRFDVKAAAIVVARDITQRKQAEAQLRQAQKMQAIGHLTGGIAHDFNNLLAVIMGNLELLHEQLTAQPRLHELAQQALRAVDRGANLTRRLLAFARRQPLAAQPTDLNRLVLGMLDLMRRTLGATIQIDTALATDLRPTLVDPDQLESSLLNLVINARDAMPQGGKLTLKTANVLIEDDYTVAQAEVRPGPYVMLAVSDTGVGMAPELLERAFEPFFTTKESGKGSGLGLSMVYGLVKQSDGHITIHSEPGQGTTVRLYLPQIATPAPAVPEPQAADASIRGRGETILAVEDDAEVRQFAVNALRGLGYTPLQAADAATALRILEATPDIALLFTDIVMPGEMDGVKLAAEAQRRYPGLPVLLTSGYTEHALIGNDQGVEGVEVLIKPYRKNELGRKLRMLLGQRDGH